MTDPVVVAGLVAGGVSLLLAVVFHIQPGQWPPDVYFGVTVPPDFPQRPEGRAIVRGYRARVWFHTSVAAALIMTSVAVRGLPLLVAGAIVLQVAGAVMAFVSGRAATLPFGAPAARGTTVVDHANVAAQSLPGGVLGQAGPFLILVLAMGYMAMAWERIPDRFPIHWNWMGQADRWGTRSFVDVDGLAVLGVIVCGLLLAIAAGVAHGPRLAPSLGIGRQGRRVGRVNLLVLLAVEYFLAATLGWFTVTLPFGRPPRGGVVLIVLAPLVIVVAATLAVRRARTADRGAGAASLGDGTPDACWKWGTVYVNPADPALFVAKRFGIGYTLNFGHPWAWPVLVLLLSPVAVLLLLLVFRPAA